MIRDKMRLEAVRLLCSRIRLNALGVDFTLRVERDAKRPEDGRIFLQVKYILVDITNGHPPTGELKEWRGRKWYLSDHMTEDEIVKTAWLAFEQAVKHEAMEGFLVDGMRPFNPHTPFTALMEASQKAAGRPEKTPS